LITHDLLITKVLPGVIIAAWVSILGAFAVPILQSALTVPVSVLVARVAASALASFIFAVKASFPNRKDNA
jgi:hypothetical protein